MSATQWGSPHRFGIINGEHLWRKPLGNSLMLPPQGTSNNNMMMSTKVNKSAAKRFRVRGSGSIRRYVRDDVIYIFESEHFVHLSPSFS
jgi:hypothetical protein